MEQFINGENFQTIGKLQLMKWVSKRSDNYLFFDLAKDRIA